MARQMGRVQRTVKALVSQEFAAAEICLNKGSPPKWESALGWGVFGAFLTLMLFGMGLLMPTVDIGIAALTLAWVFLVLTLIVALRGVKTSTRVVLTIAISVLAAWGLVQLMRHPPQSEILATIRGIPDAIYQRLAPLFNKERNEGGNTTTNSVHQQPPGKITRSPDGGSPQPQLSLTFKVSPLFTKSRKEHIISEMNQCYLYLGNMGLNPPKHIELLGTAPKKRGLGFMVFNCTEGKISDLDSWQFAIGDRDIDDPEAIRQVYSTYVFTVLMGCTHGDDGYFLGAAQLFGKYFAASYGNATGFGGIDKLYDSIWNLRKIYGRELIDTAMISTYRRLWPTEKYETEFNQWFCKRFIHGLFVVDDLHQHVDKIAKYLKDQGLYNE